MKRIIKILICFLLFLIPFHVQAGSDEYVRDDAGLLSADEVSALNSEAQKLSDQYDFALYIRTVNDESSYDDIYSYTENYYTQNNLGYENTSDGVLFLISMTSQGGSYDVYTPGNVSVKKISLDGVDIASDDAKTYLQAHDYEKACEAYLNSISSQLSYYEENGQAETRNDMQTHSDAFRYFLIFALPCIVAFIVVIVMLNKNRTKKKAYTAQQYITKNGVQMNTIQDIFLYRTEMREPLPQNDSGSGNFTSSSGGSHSGGHF